MNNDDETIFDVDFDLTEDEEDVVIISVLISAGVWFLLELTVGNIIGVFSIITGLEDWLIDTITGML